MPHFAGYVRRCDECAGKRSYPWAHHLKADRVAHMLEHDPRCRQVFELSILEETLRCQHPNVITVVTSKYIRPGDVMFVQPYRTTMITGIDGQMPENYKFPVLTAIETGYPRQDSNFCLNCARAGCIGCDGEQVDGPHADKPRGGFEFL